MRRRHIADGDHSDESEIAANKVPLHHRICLIAALPAMPSISHSSPSNASCRNPPSTRDTTERRKNTQIYMDPQECRIRTGIQLQAQAIQPRPVDAPLAKLLGHRLGILSH